MGMKEMVEEASVLLILKNEEIEALHEEVRRLREAIEILKLGKKIDDLLEMTIAS
jgi:hypothetical protein